MAATAWRIALFCALPLLTGCAADPFVDGRREAGSNIRVGPSGPNLVAICYNSQGTEAGDVLALANQECAKTGRVARFDHQDIFACSLVNPTRAYFNCVDSGGR